MGSLSPDRDTIIAMLNAIVEPGTPFEIRVLQCRRSTTNGIIADPYVKAQSGFFTDVDAAVNATHHFTGRHCAGVYVTLNSLRDHVLSWGAGRITQGKASSDADVRRYRHLYLDIDPVRPSETNATAEERDSANDRAARMLAYLRDLGWPEPVWVGSSGSGAIVLFRVNLAPDDRFLYGQVLHGLNDLFGDESVAIDTSVANPARVVRLAGTVNAKSITPTEERPWTLATGTACMDAAIVTRAQLEAVAADAPVTAKSVAPRGDYPTYDLPAILGDSGIQFRERQLTYGKLYAVDCLTSDDHDDGAVFIQFHSGAVVYRCLHDRCGGKGWADVKPPLKLPSPPTASSATLRIGGKTHEQGSVPSNVDVPTPRRRAVVTSLTDIEAKAIDWYWRGWLARSMLTIFGGYAGDGKSTICAALAAIFSTGGILPDGTRAPILNSLFLSAEEDPQYALKPRLELHRADHGRIFTMRGTQTGDDETRWTNLKTDIPLIRAVVDHHGIGVIWIDPVNSYLPGSDRNSEGDIRDGMSGLNRLMEETGVAVVGIAHVGKGDGAGRRTEQRLLGSTAITALARTVWMMTNLPAEHQPEADADNPADMRKVLGVAKANYSIRPQSLALVRPLDGPIKWLGPSPVSIEEAFTVKPEQGTKSRNAEEWLAERLAGGAREVNSIKADATDAGITYSALRSAKAALNVTAKKERSKNGAWVWRLPPSGRTAKIEGAVPIPAKTTRTFSTSEDTPTRIFSIFPKNQVETADSGAIAPKATDLQEIEDAYPAAGVTTRTFDSSPSGPLPPTGLLDDLDPDDRADVEDVVSALRQGGMPAMEAWRADVERNRDLDDHERELAMLALHIAMQEAA